MSRRQSSRVSYYHIPSTTSHHFQQLRHSEIHQTQRGLEKKVIGEEWIMIDVFFGDMDMRISYHQKRNQVWISRLRI